MGWERNYHTYYFRGVSSRGSGGGDSAGGECMHGVQIHDGVSSGENGNLTARFSGDQYHGSASSDRDLIHYIQMKTTATDAMHSRGFVDKEFVKNPEKATIGDLLKMVGDRCVYNYDLGDCWYHCLEVEKVIPAEDEEANGSVLIYDGAMRCPDEDGEGVETYQTEILDLFLKTRDEPNNNKVARELASRCFNRRHALNVMSPFRPQDFSLSERKLALAAALGSRNSTHQTKLFYSGPGLATAEIGQKHYVFKKEDDRFDHMGGFTMFNETLNVKPDPKDATLCYNCGTPHDLKACSRCQSAVYCSRSCQSIHWDASHKKKCKREKAAYDVYCEEVKTNRPNPNRFDNKGEIYRYKKYVEGNLRFRVGDYVECMMGEDQWGTGRIVKLYHREPGWPSDRPAAPYQIKLDRETANRVGISFQHAFIYCLWDDDYQIRKLKLPDKKGTGKKKRK